MKRLKYSIIAIALTSSVIAYGQKKFEGTVTYSLELLGDVDPQVASMVPSEVKAFYKGDINRMEMDNSMGTNIIITNSKDKTGVVLLDMMGKKLALKMDDDLKKKNDEKNADKFEVKITEETKEIAGYKCKKAVVTDKESKETFDIYFTNELPPTGGLSNETFKGIDGMLLEFQSSMNGMKNKMTVKKIKKDKIDDAMFTIPAEYKVVKKEDMMKEFGGGQ